MSNVSSVYIPDNVNANNNLESIMLGSMMGNGGGFGNMNSPFWAIILLAFLRNGFLGGDGNKCTQDLQLQAIREQLTNNQNSSLLMDAIKGNSCALANLATNLNLSKDAVTAAINAIQQQICNLGSQNGMNFMQVINAINSGNAALANTLQSCCCDVKQLVTQQGYETRINNIEQTNTITKGFGDIAYATQAQTTALAANQDANTRAVLGKLDQMEDSRKDREIANLTAALTAANSRAERQAELAPIYQQLNDIKCKQPETVTVPYSPITPVPSCVAWQSALYGGAYSPYYCNAARGNVFS